MKQSAGYSMLTLSVVFMLSAACFANAPASRYVTIAGTVHAVDHDSEGNAIAAVISGMGGQYQIVDNVVGKQLFKQHNKIVEATGTIAQDSEGNLTIAVLNYRILSE
jgi:hypothetical protein